MTYKLSNNLPKKRVFITGAGSGLGRALAIALATDGWTLGLGDINNTAAEATAAMCVTKGATAFDYRLDVADAQQYAEVAEDFIKDVGGIDLLINNAGISGFLGNFEQCSIDNWHWVSSINQMGVIHGCHYFIPYMKSQQQGHIFNIASAAGFVNPPGSSPYNVTKAAVIALSESLYKELYNHKVQVSVAMPTFFKTNIMSSSTGSEAFIKTGNKMVERSGLSADEVAHTMLQQLGNNKLYIILPKSAWYLHLLKRFLPTRFNNIIIKEFNKHNKKRKKATQSP